MIKHLHCSVVVIGRNEGQRLVRCLESIQQAEWGSMHHEVVYVDSRSTDGSLERATSLGARAISIGDARPCAAVARNLGLEAARAPLVLFLDGDTVLHPQFVQRSKPWLEKNPEIVAVWGHRREIYPEQSLYTKVLDLDWIFAPGPSDYFGGDVLVRRQALLDVGGFDRTLVAGEEPELCRRLRAQGWRIEHIDAPMTQHDLAITQWRGWWKRAERAGLAYAQVSERYEATPDPLWKREAQRNRNHGAILMVLPVMWLSLLVLNAWLALTAVCAAGLLWWRSARRCRWKCPEDPALSWWYAAHSHLQQIPILIGQWRWQKLKKQGRDPVLVEYKRDPAKAEEERA